MLLLSNEIFKSILIEIVYYKYDIFEGINHHSIVAVRQVETKKDFYLLVETVNRVIFYLVVNV